LNGDTRQTQLHQVSGKISAWIEKLATIFFNLIGGIYGMLAAGLSEGLTGLKQQVTQGDRRRLVAYRVRLKKVRSRSRYE